VAARVIRPSCLTRIDAVHVRLLPVLLFESAWKLIWLSVVALPATLAGHVDDALASVIFSCSLVVVIVAVVPWRYVWQRYVTSEGDR
jgi:membrane protein DedA with SNARE-associated domain